MTCTYSYTITLRFKKNLKTYNTQTKTVNTATRRKYVQSVITSAWQVKHVTIDLQSSSPPLILLFLTPGPQEWTRNEPGVNQEWRGNSQKLPEPSHPSTSASQPLSPLQQLEQLREHCLPPQGGSLWLYTPSTYKHIKWHTLDYKLGKHQWDRIRKVNITQKTTYVNRIQRTQWDPFRNTEVQCQSWMILLCETLCNHWKWFKKF